MDISLYKRSKFFMLASGLWKTPISSNPLIQKIYCIYAKMMQLNYILFNASMIIRLKELLDEIEIDKIYFDISLVIFITEMNLRVMIYLKNKVPEMFYDIIEREERILRQENKEVTSVYMKQVEYYKVATLCQCFCCALSVLWFLGGNLYLKFVTNSLPYNNFLYQLWFPFDKEKHDIIVVIYEIFMLCCGFLFNCSIQTLLQTLMVFSISQLKILQLNIRTCFDKKGTIEDVKELIRENQFLIEFITNLNEATKYVILIDFCVESVSGAGALLQVVKSKEPIDFAVSLIYVLLLFLNLLTLSWSANELIIQSTKVGYAVYESNWMDQSEEIKQLLFIMLMRSQRPLSVNVGPFRRMDNEAALLTMKGSYSYAQVMSQR